MGSFLGRMAPYGTEARRLYQSFSSSFSSFVLVFSSMSETPLLAFSIHYPRSLAIATPQPRPKDEDEDEDEDDHD